MITTMILILLFMVFLTPRAITISKETYNKLRKLKRGNETENETIKRLYRGVENGQTKPY